MHIYNIIYTRTYNVYNIYVYKYRERERERDIGLIWGILGH